MTTDYNDDIRAAVAVMRDGGIVLYPTDTVWGLGCDARRSDAVRKIFAIKRRADSKALISLVSDEEMLRRHVAENPTAEQRDFIESHASRPVTMIYPQGMDVAPELLAGDGSIGIRIVCEGFAHDLCRAMGGPVVSTSANTSGAPTPPTFSEISDGIIDAVDYVCETGRDNGRPSKPSMVARISADGSVEILRE